VASRRRLLLILLAAAVVVLAGVAIAISALAPRTGQQAATAPSSATAPPSTAAASADVPSSGSPATASPTGQAVKPAAAELLDEANTVCEMRVTEKYPTAEVQPGTKSTAKAKNGSFETTGSYTDPTAGKAAPTEFQCSSVNTSGTWTVNLERG
jgi:hypothetical protein